MFLSKALAWSPPDFLYKVKWWRGSAPKNEQEGAVVKQEDTPPPPLAPALPGKAWLKWNFQVPRIYGIFNWWGHGAGDASIAPVEKSYPEFQQQQSAPGFGVPEAAAEVVRLVAPKAHRRTAYLETPEHFQICFNFIRHLVDLCVLSFLWLCSPVFRLGLDILGLGGLVKLWLHGMGMFLVAAYGLHLVFWLVQEYLFQFACLFGFLEVLVLSVSIQAGLEVEDIQAGLEVEDIHVDGADAEGRLVGGDDDDTTDRETPEPTATAPPHHREVALPEHRMGD